MARKAEGANSAAPVAWRKKSRRLREIAAATSRGLANALIEIRQDLIAERNNAVAWAERIGRVLRPIIADPGLHPPRPADAFQARDRLHSLSWMTTSSAGDGTTDSDTQWVGFAAAIHGSAAALIGGRGHAEI